MKYLIVGSHGQLGKEFSKLLQKKDIKFTGFDLPYADVFNYAQINQAILHFHPDIVINCAAYNNVDFAELEYEEAYKVNIIGVENLAKICSKNKIKLLHFSTDYVFNGIKRTSGLYTENDIPDPINNYGRSKLEGEKILQEYCKDFLIFRLSWLYGDGKQNFVAKVLEWTQKNDIIQVSSDEISIPTSTRLVVDISFKAINNGLSGLFHLTNTGYSSRFEFAQAICKYYDLPTIIKPAKMSDFALPAKRPAFSAMSNDKISSTLDISIPHWQEELQNFCQETNNNTSISKFKQLSNSEIGF